MNASRNFFAQEQYPLVGIFPGTRRIAPGFSIKEPWVLRKTRQLSSPWCNGEVNSLREEAVTSRKRKGNFTGWQKTSPAKALQLPPSPFRPPHLSDPFQLSWSELFPSSAPLFLLIFIYEAAGPAGRHIPKRILNISLSGESSLAGFVLTLFSSSYLKAGDFVLS